MRELAEHIRYNLYKHGRIVLPYFGTWQISLPNFRNKRTILFQPDEFLTMHNHPLSLDWIKQHVHTFVDNPMQTANQHLDNNIHLLVYLLISGEQVALPGLGQITQNSNGQGGRQYSFTAYSEVIDRLDHLSSQYDSNQSVYSSHNLLTLCNAAAELALLDTSKGLSDWRHTLGNLFLFWLEECDQPDDTAVDVQTGSYLEGQGAVAAHIGITPTLEHWLQNAEDFSISSGTLDTLVIKQSGLNWTETIAILEKTKNELRLLLEGIHENEPMPIRVNLGRFGYTNIKPETDYNRHSYLRVYSYPGEDFVLWKENPKQVLI